MLSIIIENAGRKYGREWIFRKLDHSVAAGDRLVITGGNGSGKSTLLQMIAGFITPTEGQIILKNGQALIEPDSWHRHISLASPYLQLVEDLTLEEMTAHSGLFKPFKKGMSSEDVITISGLVNARGKLVRQFSSGMRQRFKLALAILSDTPLLLLDEPVSNLDREAIAWYKKMMEDYCQGRTVIVCSNAIADEHFFCTSQLDVTAFKPKRS